MDESFFSWDEFYECSEVHDSCDSSVEDVAWFWNVGDACDPFDCLLAAFLIWCGDEDKSVLLDVDFDATFCGNFLDRFAAFADDVTDVFWIDTECRDHWCVFRHLFSWSCDSFFHFFEDGETCFLGFFERFAENLDGETFYFDIHLECCDAGVGSCDFEIHVSGEIFDSLDVGEDRVAFRNVAFTGEETHGDTCDRFFDFNSGVHECECGSADGSHRTRTVTGQRL